MPRIPQSATNVDTPGALGAAPRPAGGGVSASFDTSTGTVGVAEKNAGQQLTGFASQINQLSREYDNEQRQSTVANAAAQFNFEPTLLDMKTKAPPGAPGFTEQVTDAYQDKVQDHVDNMLGPDADDQTRKDLTEKLMAQAPGVAKGAAVDEFTMRAKNQEFQTNQALDALENKVRTNPNVNFDEVAKQADDVVNSTKDLPESGKPQAVAATRSKLGALKFESLADAATDPDQVAAYRKQLEDSSQPWQTTLTPQAMESTIKHLKAQETTLQAQVQAVATTQVSSLRTRTTGENPVVVPDAEMASIGAMVRKSKSPATAEEFAILNAQQQQLRANAALPPDAIRQRVQQGTQEQQGSPRVAPELQGPLVAAAAATGGKVSPAYLAGVIGRENRGVLQGAPAAQGNGGGATQFIPSTWLGVVDQVADTTGMTTEQKLALRSNTTMNLKGAAILAAQNKTAMEGNLGRPITDGELYLGHFLGAGGGKQPGATDLIKAYQTDPTSSAAALLPAAAANNKSVFYNRDGSARSVGQVYGEITSSFGATPGRLSYAESDMNRKILTHVESGIAKDPMTFATTQYGTRFTAPPADLSQPEATGHTAMAIADFYGIPRDQMKPLTEDQNTRVSKLVKDGSVDDQAATMSIISRMGPDMARAAYKQIGDTDPVFSFAGKLQLGGASPAVVTDLLQGQKRVTQDKAINEAPAMKRQEMETEFNTTFAPAMASVPDRDRAATFEAARMLYAQRYAKDNLTGSFDVNAFRSATNAVLGRGPKEDAIGKVNGAQTLAPNGVTPDQFDDAIHKMSDADFTALSATGAPPRFTNGQVATAADIRSEGRFVAMGGDNYQIAMGSNGRLVAGTARNGGVLFYTMSAKKEQLAPILQRQTAAADIGAISEGP